jgi:5-(carboxyamino)imidazole ribonucleotide mutase
MSPRVVILMGSKSDLDHVAKIVSACEALGLETERHIASAHKAARYLLGLLDRIEAQGEAVVYITVAGRSNALSGMADASVTNPVIACPPYSASFGGADIYSSLRMPGGVAPMVVLEPEAAALAAAKILALADPDLRERVRAYQARNTEQIIADDRELGDSQ